MRLNGFNKKAVVGLGVLAKVCAKPIYGEKNCINVPEQNISNIASSYDMGVILDNIKALNVTTYKEQQNIYDSRYKRMYANFVNNYGLVLNDSSWNEVNSRIQKCLKFEFLNVDNSTWLDVAREVIHAGDVVVPVSTMVIPKADIVKNVYEVNYLKNKVVCLDKQNYDSCAQMEVNVFCKNKSIGVEIKSFYRRAARGIIIIPALMSGIILGKYIMSLTNNRINRLRQRNGIRNFNEEIIQNFEVPVRRQRIHSEWSDNTLVVSDMSESEYSDDTLLVEELESEEFEPMDS